MGVGVTLLTVPRNILVVFTSGGELLGEEPMASSEQDGEDRAKGLEAIIGQCTIQDLT